MSPARILVTGASGFVGQHLLAQLRGAFPAAEIVGTTLSHAAGALTPLDMTDDAQVAACVQTLRPDACVHLAAISAVPAARDDPRLAWRVNLDGTLTLARAVLAHAPDCRFVYVSSSEIYGRSFRAGTPLDESALLAPGNTYAATKAAADLALGAMASEGLKLVRLRPFNHTGPGQSASFVVAAFARQAARIEAGRQEPKITVGALDPYRDFLDVRDVCAAYAACLRVNEIEPGVMLNLASGTPRKIGDILHALCAEAGIAPELETGGRLLRPSEIPFAVGDARKARTLLAWEPAISWSETLRDTLNDWRARIDE